MTEDGPELLRRLAAAQNAGDVEAVLAILDPAVEFVTPRGTARGHAEIRAFMERQAYGARLVVEHERLFARDGTVVVFSRERFEDAETGAPLGAPVPAAAIARVRGGVIVRFEPREDRAAALADAGLDEDDEVRA